MADYQNDDPFAGGDKAPALSFKDAKIGTTFTGTVTGTPKLVQGRDYLSGEPAYWPDGNPKMNVVINLEVNGEDRSLWAGRPSAMFSALAQAQKDAGTRIAPGGTLTVRFVGEKANDQNPRLNPQKLYQAEFKPGNVLAADDDKPPF